MGNKTSDGWVRGGWLIAVMLVVVVVGDGYAGRPSPFTHQLLLLPATLLLLFLLCKLLWTSSGLANALGEPQSAKGARDEREGWGSRRGWLSARRAVAVAGGLSLWSIGLFYYEARHFAFLGYHVGGRQWVMFGLAVTGITAATILRRISAGHVLVWALLIYAAGMVLAIFCFPLNYLRSDMLAVISWADAQMLHGVSPYATMYVGGRVYDFPYLPGMLVAYLPAIAVRVDPRLVSLGCVGLLAAAMYWAADVRHRLDVAALLAVFVLDPFLQYRHELYLEPHWLAMVVAFVLLARGRFVWGAFVFGLSMGMYQFSWIVFPFLVLYGWHRGGWREAAKTVGAGLVGMALLVGPFVAAARGRIAHNTVGQWGTFGHALAYPVNVSYWLTYVVAPDHLLRVQAVLMVGIFVGVVWAGRCRTLADTLRWSVVALVVFVMTNSIVDGYFYLMLLVLMMVFVCLENGWIPAHPLDSCAKS